MSGRRLVNHNGRVTGPPEREVPAIKQSDLLLLVTALDAGRKLFAALKDRDVPNPELWYDEWAEFDVALKALGVPENKDA